MLLNSGGFVSRWHAHASCIVNSRGCSLWYHEGNGDLRSVFAAYDYPAVVTHPVSQRPVLYEQIVTSHGMSLFNDDPLEESREYIDRLHHSWWSPTNESKHEIYEKDHEMEMDFVKKIRDVEMQVAVGKYCWWTTCGTSTVDVLFKEIVICWLR